jgi:hypothetical protein
MQEHKGETQGLLDGDQNQREKVLQQVEYNQAHKLDDWRAKKEGGAITNYKLTDL